MGKIMKVKFLKKYKGDLKTFQKDDIVKLHWTLAEELLRKKIVTKSNTITKEDIALKNLEDISDGNNRSD